MWISCTLENMLTFPAIKHHLCSSSPPICLPAKFTLCCRVSLPPGVPRLPVCSRTAEEGNCAEGLLHVDLRDGREVVMRVVGHHDAREQDCHDP